MKPIIMNPATLRSTKTAREFAKAEKAGFSVDGIYQAIIENTAENADSQLQQIYEKDSTGLAFSVNTTLRGGYLVGLANTTTPAKYRTLPLDKLSDALKMVAYQLMSLQMAFYKDGSIKVLPFNGIGKSEQLNKDSECIGVFDFLSEVAVKGRYVSYDSKEKKWCFATTDESDAVRLKLRALQAAKNKVSRDLARLESYMQMYEPDASKGTSWSSACITDLDAFWTAASDFVSTIQSDSSSDKVISSQLAYIIANFQLLKEEMENLSDLTKASSAKESDAGLLFGRDTDADKIAQLIGNVKTDFPENWSIKSWLTADSSSSSAKDKSKSDSICPLVAYAKNNFNELLAGDILWDAALKENFGKTQVVTNGKKVVTSKKTSSTLIKLPSDRGITMPEVRRQLFAAFKPLDFSTNLNREVAQIYAKMAKPAKLYNKLLNHTTGDAGVTQSLIPFYLTTLTMGSVGTEFRKRLFEKAADIALSWGLETGSKGSVAKMYAARFENIISLAVQEDNSIAEYVKQLPGIEAGKDLSSLEIPGFGVAATVIDQFVSDFSCVVSYLCHVFGAYCIESGFSADGSRSIDKLCCCGSVAKAKFVYPREMYNKILYINQTLDQRNPGQDTIMAVKSVKDKLDRKFAPIMQLWHPNIKKICNYVEWPAEKFDMPFKVLRMPGGASLEEGAVEKIALTDGSKDPSKVSGIPVAKGNVLFVDPEHVPTFDHTVEISSIVAALKPFHSQLTMTLTAEEIQLSTESRAFFVPVVPVANARDVSHNDNAPIEQQPGWLHFNGLSNSEGFFNFDDPISDVSSVSDYFKLLSIIVPADVNWVPTSEELQAEWEHRIKMFCCRSVLHKTSREARFGGSTKYRLTYIDQKGDQDLLEAIKLSNEVSKSALESTPSMVTLLTDVKNAKSFAFNSINKVFVPSAFSDSPDLSNLDSEEMSSRCLNTVDIIPIDSNNKLQFSVHLRDFSALTPTFARAIERFFAAKPGETYEFIDPLLGPVTVKQIVKEVDGKKLYEAHECQIEFSLSAFVSQTNPLAGAIEYAPNSVMVGDDKYENEYNKHPFTAYIDSPATTEEKKKGKSSKITVVGADDGATKHLPIFGFIHKTGFADVDNFVMKAWEHRGIARGGILDAPVALKNSFFMVKDVNNGNYLKSEDVYLPRCLATNEMIRTALEVSATEGMTSSMLRRIVRIVNVLILSAPNSSAALHHWAWARSFLSLANEYWGTYTDFYFKQSLSLGRNNNISLGPDQNDLNPVGDYHSSLKAELDKVINASLTARAVDMKTATAEEKEKVKAAEATIAASVAVMESKINSVDSKLASFIKQNSLYLQNMLIGEDSITIVKKEDKKEDGTVVSTTVVSTILDEVIESGRLDGIINTYQNFALKSGTTSIFNKSPAAMYEFSYVAGSAEAAFRAWVNENLYNLDIMLADKTSKTGFSTTIDASTSWFDLSAKTFEGLSDGADEKDTADESPTDKVVEGLTEELNKSKKDLAAKEEQLNKAIEDQKKIVEAQTAKQQQLVDSYEKLPDAVKAALSKEQWENLIKE